MAELENSDNLEKNTIADLRRKAQAVYGIPVTKDMEKDEIINAIRNKQRNQQFAKIVDTSAGEDAPLPGWARIEIFLDNSPTASNRPVYINVNGYKCTVPRGHVVDVPIKVMNALNDAREIRMKEDFSEPLNSPRRFKQESTHSYPFRVYQVTDGPDPRPGNQAAREAKVKPRETFRDYFGFWPSAEQLKEAIKDGVITVKGTLGKNATA